MNEIMMKPVCTNCGHIFKRVIKENERLDMVDDGRTYLRGIAYGFYINLFGVFEDEQTAMKAKEDMEEKYYKDSLKSDWLNSDVERSDVKFKIQEVPINQMFDIYLEGYAE